MMIEGARTRLIGECLLLEKAPPKVTPQHAAAVRVQVIYNSFRARGGGLGVQMLLAWRVCQLKSLCNGSGSSDGDPTDSSLESTTVIRAQLKHITCS